LLILGGRTATTLVSVFGAAVGEVVSGAELEEEGAA
jgi:hypothetical protein